MTQREQILKELKRRWTTGFDALRECGTMKLATRVSEFRREGVAIQSRWVEQGGKRFMAYRVAK